jgi:selenocysteine lyase/cysteine desulfurase
MQTHSLFGPGSDRVGVVAFTIDGLDSSLVSTALSVEHGIGVRDGKFCAHPLVDALLADGSDATPTTAVRASLGLATRPEHVERLVSAVGELAAYGPKLAYSRGPGGWEPTHDPRVVDLPRPW